MHPSTQIQIDRDTLGRLVRRELATLHIAPPGPVRGRRQGDHASRARGGGIDFADHREYQPGDDLRRLDWRTLARHDTALVRRFHEARNLRIALHLDASSSMAFGNPRKVDVAATFATALALVATRRRDRFSLTLDARDTGDSFPGQDARGSAADGPSDPPAPVRTTRLKADASSEAAVARVLGALERCAPGGTARPGLGHLDGSDHAVLVTDCLAPAPRRRRMLRSLAGAGRQATLIHVLSDAELAPELTPGMACVDAESGERIQLGGGDLRARYQEALARYLDDVRTSCRRLGVRYALLTTDDADLGNALRASGLVHAPAPPAVTVNADRCRRTPGEHR